jgi:hypothetical protein
VPKNEMKIELIRHVAQQSTAVGVVDVVFNQCFVQCNGRRVGIYCGLENQPGKHLSFTEALPESLQKDIADAVAKKVGGIMKFTAPPPEEHEETND